MSPAKREGRLGLETQESAGKAFQVDNCSLASGQPLARIWPFRVIVIGCTAQSLLDYLPGYLGAP